MLFHRGEGRSFIAGRNGLENKRLVCKDCGTSFDFTVRDQQFYAEKGFTNEPQRCRDCRTARKSQREGGALGAGYPPGGGAREMFEAVCAQCMSVTTVPFKPRGDKPVYCRTCFNGMNAVRAY